MMKEANHHPRHCRSRRIITIVVVTPARVVVAADSEDEQRRAVIGVAAKAGMEVLSEEKGDIIHNHRPRSLLVAVILASVPRIA